MLKLVLKVLGISGNGRPTAGESPETRMQLAASVILLRCASESPELGEDMPGLVMGTILITFTLPPLYIQELIDITRSGDAAKTDLSMFKEHINHYYSREERIGILDASWKVIYADEQLRKHEACFARKLGEYLWLDERDFRESWERAKKGMT